jgi:bifunctional non-homologous end joining protein LigD
MRFLHTRLWRQRQNNAHFIEPMLLLRSATIPDGPGWIRELKLDGYRALAYKRSGQVHLRSHNDKDFAGRYPAIAAALKSLPDETVIDGEIVATDAEGRPSFNLLQNYGSSNAPLLYFVFDVMIATGRDLTGDTLDARRAVLEAEILPHLSDPVRWSPALPGSVADLIQSVKAQGFEGLVAKRRSSRYEAGQRSGAWVKMRVNRGQEFVIGGYTVGGTAFDALVFGYYEGKDLIYAARTRNGFTPALRQELMKKFRPLEVKECPFANLPEARSGRWGVGLTAAKMEDCRWLKPSLVGQFEFLEWTPDNHLRHARFMALRDDKSRRQIRREE